VIRDKERGDGDGGPVTSPATRYANSVTHASPSACQTIRRGGTAGEYRRVAQGDRQAGSATCRDHESADTNLRAKRWSRLAAQLHGQRDRRFSFTLSGLGAPPRLRLRAHGTSCASATSVAIQMGWRGIRRSAGTLRTGGNGNTIEPLLSSFCHRKSSGPPIVFGTAAQKFFRPAPRGCSRFLIRVRRPILGRGFRAQKRGAHTCRPPIAAERGGRHH